MALLELLVLLVLMVPQWVPTVLMALMVYL